MCIYIYIGDIPWIFHALITTCQLGCTPSWPLPLSFSRDASASPSRNSNSTIPPVSKSCWRYRHCLHCAKRNRFKQTYMVHIIYILYIYKYVYIYIHIHIYILMIHDDPYSNNKVVHHHGSSTSSSKLNFSISHHLNSCQKKCFQTIASQKTLKIPWLQLLFDSLGSQNGVSVPTTPPSQLQVWL